MGLDVERNGIAVRHEDGNVTLLRFAKNGSGGSEIEVPPALADVWRLATGDVVEGTREAIDAVQAVAGASAEWYEDYELAGQEEQRDEPGALRGVSVPVWISERILPSERQTTITRVNGLAFEEAEDRPGPRKRNNAERSAPKRLLTLAMGADDTTGRMLDFAAPLGAGSVGVIYGPHASGLTRTLEAVVRGARTNAPDVIVFVLLLRARSEEVTEWRRRVPGVEVIVCPSSASGAAPEQTLHVASLVMACVQRQSELGCDVLLAVDSLTGLWGAMLEAEHADAQHEADQSKARQSLREWVQKAGCFGGPGLLGNAIGGSLTLIGTVWQQTVDEEAEEERDIHPHLRLMEHLLHETGWRIPLSETLLRERLFPAIDTSRCVSQSEAALLAEDALDTLRDARAGLALKGDLPTRHLALLDALDTTPDNEALVARFAVARTKTPLEASAKGFWDERFWAELETESSE